MALAHRDVEFEDVDDLALGFALLGNQLDAVAAGQAGEVCGGDVAQRRKGRGAVHIQQLFDQEIGRDLDEFHIRTLQVGEVEIQRLDLVDREAEAEIGQLGHVAGLDSAAGVEGRLAQLEDQGLVQVAVLGQEVEELREEGLVAQRGQRHVAEDADLAVLTGQTAHDLGAAEQQQVVDGRDQTFALGDRQVFGGHHHPVVGGAQTGEAFIEDGPALGQGNDRLQVEVDAVLGEGLVNGRQQDVGLLLVAGLEGADWRRAGHAFVDRVAHLLDQGLQHPHLAGQGFGRGQGPALDGLGQFGQGPLGRLHCIGQQAVGLPDLIDLLLERSALGAADDHGVGGGQKAGRADAGRHACSGAQTGAPDEGAGGHRQEQVAEEEKAVGKGAHGNG